MIADNEGEEILDVDDGEEILEVVLRFGAVLREDSGCYECHADNGYSEKAVVSKAVLIVECKY